MVIPDIKPIESGPAACQNRAMSLQTSKSCVRGPRRLAGRSAAAMAAIVVTLAALLVLVVVVVTSPTLGQFLDLVWLRLQILLGLK